MSLISTINPLATDQLLPSSLTRLSYIEFTGAEAVNTDLSYKNFSFKTHIYQSPEYGCITLLAISNYNQYGVYYHPEYGYSVGIPSLGFEVIAQRGDGNALIDCASTHEKLIINGSICVESMPSFTEDAAVILGGCQRALGLSPNISELDRFKGKVYFWQGYTSKKLVARLIPCLDSTGKACFYDTMRKKNYYSYLSPFTKWG